MFDCLSRVLATTTSTTTTTPGPTTPHRECFIQYSVTCFLHNMFGYLPHINAAASGFNSSTVSLEAV